MVKRLVHTTKAYWAYDFNYQNLMNFDNMRTICDRFFSSEFVWFKQDWNEF